MSQRPIRAESSFVLTCLWWINPASGRLECRWSRAGAPIARREIMAHFALAA
jgi:hypothetical protein